MHLHKYLSCARSVTSRHSNYRLHRADLQSVSFIEHLLRWYQCVQNNDNPHSLWRCCLSCVFLWHQSQCYRQEQYCYTVNITADILPKLSPSLRVWYASTMGSMLKKLDAYSRDTLVLFFSYDVLCNLSTRKCAVRASEILTQSLYCSCRLKPVWSSTVHELVPLTTETSFIAHAHDVGRW